MRTARRTACALWLAALFACPAAATAASVVVVTHCDRYGCRDSLVYSAARGERNDVTVVEEGDVVTIRDSAGIQAGGACEALDALSARCALQSFSRSARFQLRDRADRLDARALESVGPSLEGGAGDDRLVGPDAIGALFRGGPGDDEMTGGPHPDRFETNRRDGSDTMDGGGPPPLVNPSYPGRDEVFYGRARSVRVALDGRPNDGAPRERDNVLSVEGVWTGAGEDVVTGGPGAEYIFAGAGADLLRGGGGADRLVGGDRVSVERDLPFGSPDRLEGGPGPDVLDGQGGSDLLIGGSGRDQLDGGRGRDRIRSRDPDRDWVLCGRGFDRLRASAADVLMRGCERQSGATTVAEGIVNWRFNTVLVSFILGCPVAATQNCEGTLTLSVPGHADATSPYSVKPGMAANVDLPLASTDMIDAAGKLSGAVASTAGDSARFGELPEGPSDSLRDALGIPFL